MADEVMIKFGGDTSAVATALRGLSGIASNALAPIKSLFSSFVIPLDVTAAIGKIVDSMREAVASIRQIKRVSDETGISSRDWQNLAFAFKTVGSDADIAEKMVGKLGTKIGEAHAGAQDAIDSFARWHVNIYNANGSLKSTTEILHEAINQMNMMGNSADQDAMAMQIFGDKSKTAIAGLNQYIHQHPISVISDADIERVNKEALAWDRFTEVIKQANIHFAVSISQWWAFKKLTGQPVVFDGNGNYLPNGPVMTNRLRAGVTATDTGQMFGPSMPGHPAFDRANRESQEASERAREKAYDESLMGQEKLNNLKDREVELNRMIAKDLEDASDSEESVNKLKEHRNELDQNAIEQAQTIRQIEEQTAIFREQQKEAGIEIRHLERDRSENLMNPYRATIANLAARAGAPLAGQGSYGEYTNPNAYGLAYNIQVEKSRLAQDIFQYGNYGAAGESGHKQWAENIKKMEDTLAKAGYTSPDHSLESIDDNIAKAQEHLAYLVDQARTHGLPVMVANGQ